MKLALVLAVHSGVRAAKEPGTAQGDGNGLAILATKHLQTNERGARAPIISRI